MSGAVTATSFVYKIFSHFMQHYRSQWSAFDSALIFYYDVAYNTYEKKVKRNCHSFIFTVYGVGSLKTSIYISYCRGIVK